MERARWGLGSGAIMFGLDFHGYLGSALGVGREGGTISSFRPA